MQGLVLDNIEAMFTDVNTEVGTIAGEVGQTPSSWNSGIFSPIENLSELVMVPIAGIIISILMKKIICQNSLSREKHWINWRQGQILQS